MIPPTPTPLPAGEAVINLDTYSLWAGTDTAIHAWRWLGHFGTVLQLLILLALVIAVVFILYKFAQKFIGGDEQS